MEGRDSRSDRHGGDDVLSTKSAECVGQAALLATGQSFTATSDIWQPSRSPYTIRFLATRQQFARIMILSDFLIKF